MEEECHSIKGSIVILLGQDTHRNIVRCICLHSIFFVGSEVQQDWYGCERFFKGLKCCFP